LLLARWEEELVQKTIRPGLAEVAAKKPVSRISFGAVDIVCLLQAPNPFCCNYGSALAGFGAELPVAVEKGSESPR
jgi:hypothetical protein